MLAIYHDLKGKHVFITGGGSGIGASITEGFLEQGAKVSFVQRSDASEFVDQMDTKHGQKPLYMPCDITDLNALESAIARAGETNGAIDILINNAANDMRMTIEETTEEQWDWSQSINLKAYFFACRAVIPQMRAQGQGAIINFSSISYMMGAAGYLSYITANSGINGMTRGMAREVGPDKIRVNAIAPGWVLTDKQLDKWATPESLAEHLDKQCLKEHLKPEDIVGACLFLASDASRMMTGQALVIDGGVVTTG